MWCHILLPLSWYHIFHANGLVQDCWLLMAPSHYLNQCWLTIIEFQRQSHEGSLKKYASAINNKNQIENYLYEISPKSPRSQWVNFVQGYEQLPLLMRLFNYVQVHSMSAITNRVALIKINNIDDPINDRISTGRDLKQLTETIMMLLVL